MTGKTIKTIKGSGFGGVWRYIYDLVKKLELTTRTQIGQMIGKTTKGNGFSGVLRYIFEKPSAEYLGGNMAATTPRLLAHEFREIANHNHSVQKPVVHISLSPSPTEKLPDFKALDLAQAYMEKIGFSDCQWILVKHSDTQTESGLSRPHFHIVANRVRQTDYKVVSAWRDWRRSEVALRELEIEFGLVEVQSSWEFEQIAPSNGQQQKVKRELLADEPVLVQLQKVIDTAAQGEPTMPEFIGKLKGKGVKAIVHFQSTGRVQGLTYEMGGINFSGTKLGKAYTFPGIQKYRGVSYEEERDLGLLRVEEQEKKGIKADAEKQSSHVSGEPKQQAESVPKLDAERQKLKAHGKPKSRGRDLELS